MSCSASTGFAMSSEAKGITPGRAAGKMLMSRSNGSGVGVVLCVVAS